MDRWGGALSRRLAACAATLLLVLAGCGPAASSPTAVATPTPVATPEVTASPEPTASPVATPEPTQAAVNECTPGAPTALSTGWTTLDGEDGDYRFAHPSEWISAGQDIPASSAVSPATFSETGLADDATQFNDLVRSTDVLVGVGAFVMEGINTPTEPLFERELAWLKSQPQLTTVLDEDLEACIGGSTARGFSSTWEFPTGPTHLVIFILQRNGKMYQVQLTTDDPAQELTFVELLSSWQWTEPAGPGTDLDGEFAATDFKIVGTATDIDRTLPGRPNPASFQSAFPPTSVRIYVIYELDDGVADTVQFSWKQEGREIVTSSFDYAETATFAWGWITPDPATGRFDAGSYTVTLTLVNSGDTVTVPFTVE